MDKIMKKLESLITNYLDQIEEKPIKTLVLTLVLYVLFNSMSKKGG